MQFIILKSGSLGIIEMKLIYILLALTLTLPPLFVQAKELTDEQITQIVAEATASPENAVELAVRYPEAAEAIIVALQDVDPGLREAIAKELRWRKFICEHIDEQTIEMRSLQTGCKPKEENDNPAIIHPSQS